METKQISLPANLNFIEIEQDVNTLSADQLLIKYIEDHYDLSECEATKVAKVLIDDYDLYVVVTDDNTLDDFTINWFNDITIIKFESYQDYVYEYCGERLNNLPSWLIDNIDFKKAVNDLCSDVGATIVESGFQSFILI